MVLPTLILRHAGLVRPYDFERLLCVLAAGLLAIVVAACALGCALTGELIRYTPREDYFIYLAALVVAGAVLARWPAIAAVPLALATIDLSLGMGSLALRETGHAFHSILPHNYNLDRRFEWHALLQARPIPSLSVEVTKSRRKSNRAVRRISLIGLIRLRAISQPFGGLPRTAFLFDFASAIALMPLPSIIVEHQCKRCDVVDRVRDDRDQQVRGGVCGDQSCQIQSQECRQNCVQRGGSMGRSERQI